MKAKTDYQHDPKISAFDSTLSVYINKVSEMASLESDVASDMTEVIGYQELERGRAVVPWFSEINHEAILAATRTWYQPSTGSWLLWTNKFLDWVHNDHHATILCTGVPCSGSTIMISVIVVDMRYSFDTSTDFGIANPYSHFERTIDERAILSSLLKQQPNYRKMATDANSKFNKTRTMGSRPPFADIKYRLQTIMAELSGVLFVIDVLDECQSKELRQVLKTIGRLQRNIQSMDWLNTIAPSCGAGPVWFSENSCGIRKRLGPRMRSSGPNTCRGRMQSWRFGSILHSAGESKQQLNLQS